MSTPENQTGVDETANAAQESTDNPQHTVIAPKRQPGRGVIIGYDDIVSLREFFSNPKPSKDHPVTIGHVLMFSIVDNIKRRMGANETLAWASDQWNYAIKCNDGVFAAGLTMLLPVDEPKQAIRAVFQVVLTCARFDEKQGRPIPCKPAEHRLDIRGRLWWIAGIGKTQLPVSLNETDTLERFYENASHAIAVSSVMAHQD